MPLPMQQVNYVPMAPVPMIHTSGLSNIGMVMQIPGPTPPSLSSMTRPKFVRMVTPGGSQVPLPTFQITNPNPVNQAPPDTSKYNVIFVQHFVYFTSKYNVNFCQNFFIFFICFTVNQIQYFAQLGFKKLILS